MGSNIDPQVEKPDPSAPPRYYWREQLAGWPDVWREEWGRLSNENEIARGLDWRTAEIEAFEHVSAKKAKAEAAPLRRRAS